MRRSGPGEAHDSGVGPDGQSGRRSTVWREGGLRGAEPQRGWANTQSSRRNSELDFARFRSVSHLMYILLELPLFSCCDMWTRLQRVAAGPQQCDCGVGSRPEGPEVCVGRGVENFRGFTRFWRAPYGEIRSGEPISVPGPRASARRFLALRAVARRWAPISAGGVCAELPTPQSHCCGPGGTSSTLRTNAVGRPQRRHAEEATTTMVTSDAALDIRAS
jgi:hypothetical protein